MSRPRRSIRRRRYIIRLPHRCMSRRPQSWLRQGRFITDTDIVRDIMRVPITGAPTITRTTAGTGKRFRAFAIVESPSLQSLFPSDGEREIHLQGLVNRKKTEPLFVSSGRRRLLL